MAGILSTEARVNFICIQCEHCCRGAQPLPPDPHLVFSLDFCFLAAVLRMNATHCSNCSRQPFNEQSLSDTYRFEFWCGPKGQGLLVSEICLFLFGCFRLDKVLRQIMPNESISGKRKFAPAPVSNKDNTFL